MKKKTFIKKVTALSLCAVLLLPAGTLAAEEPAEAVTKSNRAVGTMTGEAAGTESSLAVGTETEEAAGTESGLAAETETGELAGTETEEETAGTPSEKENTSRGYVLRHFILYNDGEMVMNMNTLQAELDFAKVDGASGVRLFIGSEGTEAGYIAASYKDDTILLVLHGALSGQTAKYKIDRETLSAILDSDAFQDFLGGTDTADSETVPESEEPEESETDGSESEELKEEQTEETESREPEESETDGSESEELKEEQTEETESREPEESETDGSESEKPGENETNESESGGFIINGLSSLSNFMDLLNEACVLLNESFVKNEEVDLGQETLYRSGIVLDREHMNRLLEICSELGFDGGMKEKFDAQDIQPEGGALFWGSDGGDYRAAAGSFGISVGDKAPVWSTFGVDMDGKELTVYDYRMPDQQASGIESGMEIAFGPADPESSMSWMPLDDTGAVDVSELEPDGAIEMISTDVQTVLYDMMGGVLSAVLEEIPQETFNEILGIDAGEEAVSEPESETETDTEDRMNEPESETETGTEERMNDQETVWEK